MHEPTPDRLVVKLMDFGISKFTEHAGDGKTGVGVLMGTPEYMSPEQTEGAADVISKIGGHFGASLGVAELTVALHYVFDTPSDRLVWVSAQNLRSVDRPGVKTNRG